MSTLRGGLRILRGRLALCRVLELADEDRDSHPGMLRHGLSAGCRHFHLEVWKCEGKWATILPGVPLLGTSSTNQFTVFTFNIAHSNAIEHRCARMPSVSLRPCPVQTNSHRSPPNPFN